MTKYTKTLISAVATAALMAPAAFAEEPQEYTPSSGNADVEFIDQVQLGNVWSNVQVHVPTSTGNVISNSLAVGNTTTAINERGSLAASIDQQQRGAVEANTDVWAGSVHGDVVATTNATGNSSYAGNWHGNTDVDIWQASRENVTATSRVDVEDALAVSAHTSAVANTAEIEVDFADVAEGSINQRTQGSVFAGSDVEVGFAEEFVQNTAIAAGNSGQAHVGDTADASISVNQSTNSYETIVASAQTRVDDVVDIANTSAAAGNQFTGSNFNSSVEFGVPSEVAQQTNRSEVFASSDVVAGQFFGSAASTASGVGNAFSASSIYGGTNTDVNQLNTGNVGSDATLNASSFSGGAGFVTATSFGNSFSSVGQETGLTGGVRQVNRGNVTASTSFRTPGSVGSVSASSSAIGNSATVETRSNNTGRGN